MQRFKRHVLEKYGVRDQRAKLPHQIPITANAYSAKFAYNWALREAAYHRIEQLAAIDLLSRRGESRSWLCVVIGGRADSARACGFYLPGGAGGS